MIEVLNREENWKIESQLLVRSLRELADQIERRGAKSIGGSISFAPIEDPQNIDGAQWKKYHQGPHRSIHITWDYMLDDHGQPYKTVE